MRVYDLNRPVYNFSPGPGAVIPRPVLADMQAEMLNWNGTGLSVMELSHRAPEFQVIIDDAMVSHCRPMYRPSPPLAVITYLKCISCY